MINSNKQFEELIRQTLENFEVEYNSAHWDELENRLNIIGQGVVISMSTFYSAFMAAGIFLAGLVYFGLPENANSGGKSAVTIAEEEDSVQNGIGESDFLFTETSIAEINNVKTADEIENILLAKPEASNSSSADYSETNENSLGDSKSPESSDSMHKMIITKSKNKSTVSQGCEGAPVTFVSGLDKESGNYLWNFGDGYFSNDINPEHTFSSVGVFDVSLLVTPLTGGNITPMTIQDQIKINPRPKASFDYSYQINYINVPQVQFENHSSQAVKVIWKVGDEIISTENNPIYNFSKKGTYQVDLIAINEFGCEDITSKNVVIKEDYNLMAPSEFTPDNDGKNDFFMPEAIKLIDGKFTLKILDSKTDMVIFESSDFNKPWNGTIAGTNVKASRDTYPWVVNIVYRNGSKDEFKGEIKLKR
jgi:gliding motility-associated-like protein